MQDPDISQIPPVEEIENIFFKARETRLQVFYHFIVTIALCALPPLDVPNALANTKTHLYHFLPQINAKQHILIP